MNAKDQMEEFFTLYRVEIQEDMQRNENVRKN
jgi:hypothetical protein